MAAMLSRDTFRNPPAGYRPIPFWFWNSKLRNEEIEGQIRDFHAKGIGGFFIHARFGLETEYLSREWMDCIKHAVRVAEELGMEVWLYDENGFPSGIGDLNVSRIREYRSRFIDLTERDVSSGEEIDIALPSGEVVLAYAYSRGKPEGDRTDLTGSIRDSRLAWKAPEGEWSVVVYSRRVLEDPNDVVYGVDYLNAEAMRFFLDFTLDPYEKALGQHFGKTIKGIFTDEPTLLPWHHDLCWYGLREHTRVVVWDDAIEQGMGLRVHMGRTEFLPHLFFEIDEDTPSVRRAFWQTVAELYVKAFFEPYRQWCDDHNLKLTGHVLFEEGLYLNTDFQSDITELLSRMHIPGTDHLGEVTETPYGGFSNTPRHLTNLQGEKLVSSIAHFTGKEAAITETYGCAGWGLTFEKMKWMADWQYSLGLNMLCPHAVFYSIEGFRKSDAPPSENHMAGWPHYRHFGDYIGRLSYMLRAGRHVAKVALFYPLRQFWGLHTVGCEGENDRTLSDSFDLCASILPRLHFDYDILSEQALASATVANGRIRIQDEDYSVLIAPPLAVEGRALEVLQEFLAGGGTWVFPPATRGEPEREQIDREIALVRNSMGPEAADRMRGRIELEWPERPRHIVLERGEQGTVIATLAGTEDPEGVGRALDDALREAIVPDVEIAAEDGAALPDVRCVHRSDGDHDIYFLINTSDRPAGAVVLIEAVGAVEEWDPETGDSRPALGVEPVGMRTRIRMELPPFGSTIYVVDGEREARSRPSIQFTRQELLEFDDEWQFRPSGPNALVLSEWAFQPRVHGSGEDYSYTASFECEHVPSDLMLMLDDVEYRASLMGGMDLTVEVNDRTWHKPKFGWHLDRGFKTLDIVEAVERGENKVRILIKHSAWSGQPHLINSPPVLLGSFACDPASRKLLRPVEAAPSGSWTQLGYPFFSGTAAYRQSFKAPRNTEAARLLICTDAVSDMVEVWVNDQPAGVRLWRPWEVEVTDFVNPGTNVLELRVTNSMANFLESQPRPSGLMGRVRLVAER